MTRPVRSALRLVVAAVVAAATWSVLPAGPAAAAACPSASGVTVVVDYHQLGGGVDSRCVSGDGGTAATLFGNAGFALTYAQRDPSFVCRVQGKPASDPCVDAPPANAYWSLWWTKGTSTKWTYASLGVGSLKVPAGGSLAFSWNGSSRSTPPGMAAPVHQRPAQPSSTPKPTHKPTPKPTHTAAPKSAQQSTAAPTPTPKATHKPTPHQTPSASLAPASVTPTPSPTLSPTGSPTVAPATADPADPGGGLPAWVGPAVVVLVFAGAGTAFVVRRRRSATP